MKEFKTSKKLLGLVMKKQTGKRPKAIFEAFQNSIDSNATNIEITVLKTGFTIKDNGIGMNEKEIDSFFAIFGNTHKDEDMIGEFCMGRGQIFSFGFTSWWTQNWKMTVNIEKRLAFTMRKTKKFVKGTTISCCFFNPIPENEVDNIVSGLYKSFLPRKNTTITINGNELNTMNDIVNENDDFCAFESDFFSDSCFSQGIYVNRVGSMFGYNLNCKIKMPLNFARNDFLEDQELYKKMLNFRYETETIYITKIDDYTANQGLTIIKLVSGGMISFDIIENKKIIELANGEMVSLAELKGKTVIYGDKDKRSDKVIQMGHIVINEAFRYYLSKLNTGIVLSKFTVEDFIPKGYYRVCQVYDLLRHGKKALLNYYYCAMLNDAIFSGLPNRSLIVGESDISDAWTNGSSFICVNRTNFETEINIKKVLMNVYELLLHEYSHESDSKSVIDHDMRFYKRFHDKSFEKRDRFMSFILNTTINDVREEYKYAITEDEISYKTMIKEEKEKIKQQNKEQKKKKKSKKLPPAEKEGQTTSITVMMNGNWRELTYKAVINSKGNLMWKIAGNKPAEAPIKNNKKIDEDEE